MSEVKESQMDDTMGRLILEIKALTLLSENDEALSKTVQENIVNSHNEQVGKFVSLIRAEKKSESHRGNIFIALGELVLATFLTVAGLSLLAPSLMGLQSPAQLLSYFKEAVSGISTSSLSDPLIPVLDFLFSIALLLGSFYLLRRISTDLKNAGLS